MWLLLILISSTGYFLFSDLKTNGYIINFYTEYSSALYQTLVIQSSANFPDIGLPFVGV